MNRINEIETRLAAIDKEIEAPDANFDALEEVVRALNAERDQLKESAKMAEELRKMIAGGAGTTKESHNAETDQGTEKEARNSKAYIDAYAEYIKTGNDAEVRSLLTKNVASGTIPVPEFLQEMIETAWERDGILSRVTRTNIRGNIKVPFELSADGAYVHVEGTSAPTEEALTFGLVSLIPETIKKWVSFSDEVNAMKGE